MDLSFVENNEHQGKIPSPLSFKRNGCGQLEDPNKRHDKMFIPNEDKDGKFFGASIRIGPHMSVQEDRFMYKENFQGSQINAFYAVFDGHGGYHAADFCQ